MNTDTTITPVLIRPTTAPIDVNVLDAEPDAPVLDAKHAAYLATRGVSPLVAQARGYFSCTPLPLPDDSPTCSPLQMYGWSTKQNAAFRGIDDQTGQYVRALVIPLWSADEEHDVNVQVRLDSPRLDIDIEATAKANPVPKMDADGKPVPSTRKTVTKYREIKFEVPAFASADCALPGTNGQATRRGSNEHDLPADVHPIAAEWAEDTSVPVLLTEGIPKADAVLSEALRTGVQLVPIALTGVTMGYHAAGSVDNPTDRPVLVAETLGRIPWAGRTVFLAFDADWAVNKMVKSALATTAKLLTAEGATVYMVCIPATETDPKRGIDDYLAAARAAGEDAPLAVLLNELTLNPAQAETLTRYYSADDTGRGDRLASQCLSEKDALFNTDSRTWVHWNGQVWERQAEALLTRRAMELTERDVDNQQNYKQGRSRLALRAAVDLAATHADIAVNELDFDCEPNLLNVKNGVIDLLTGELLAHDRAYKMTKQSGTTYDKNAESPTFMKFLDETFGRDQELIDYAQRAFGSALFGEVREEFLIVCTGTGRNGKGALLKALSFAMGLDYVVTLNPRILLGEMTDEELAELVGKRLAIMQETKAGQSMDTSALKKFASGDPLSARKLFKDRFTFNPSHTGIFITNHLPNIPEQDRGTWRRIKPIPFNNQVSDEDENGDLGAMLQLEAGGILAWLVRGALAFRESGLGTCTAVTELLESYMSAGDTLGQFLEEYCLVDPTSKANRSVTYRAFQSFCMEHGIRAWTQRSLVAALGERGIIDKLNPATKGNDGAWYWSGFKLNPASPSAKPFVVPF